MKEYDVIIIGGGPAGLSAALYAARALLRTLVLEKNTAGGLITTTTEVENYPGSEPDATGFSLTDRMLQQSEEAGAEFDYDTIVKIKKEENLFYLLGEGGEEYTAKSVILAMGSQPRLLGVKGELEFRGKGVSYCATCDAGFFRGKHVAVVGGGDTAVKEATFLTRFAQKVTLIHRRDAFRASRATTSKIAGNEKMHYLFHSVVEEIVGDQTVKGLKVRDLTTNEIYDYPVDGIFVFAGFVPNSELVKDFAQLDEKGYIVTNEAMHTSVPGLFAAGDVRDTVLRQVITAAADGAICGVEAENYIESMK